MKKLVSILLCIIMLLWMVAQLVSCTGKEREATEAEYEKIEEIFSNICIHLQIEEEIPLPTIKVVSQKKIEKLSGIQASAAFYEGTTRIVYLVDLDAEYSESAVAHEMIHYLNHYLSEFSDSYGFDYFDENGIECGYFLTEGITQYLSSQVYPIPEGYAAYPFEVMLVEQLVAIIGEQTLIETFLTSDIETFKNAFNEIAYRAGFTDETGSDGIEKSPYEAFVLFLDISSSHFLTGDILFCAQYANASLSVVCMMAEEVAKKSTFDSIYNNFMDKYGATFWFLV